MPDGILDFARHLNSVARSVLKEDGEHVAMFFLQLESGAIEVRQFEEAFERPVGGSRSLEMADAVRATNATSIAFVSEAWSAPEESVPDRGGAGDAPDAREILLLAALDRSGNTVSLETPITRLPDGALGLGETEEDVGESKVRVLDDVRVVWGLEPS
jgi:hypothetical protein